MNAAHLSPDERKRRGIRRDGQPCATPMPGYARTKRAAKRAEAEERAASALPRPCGHRHTTAGAAHCGRAFRARIPGGGAAVSNEASAPKRRPSRDGIYPRCVWCDGENYALAVLAYSRREVPCAVAPGCGRYLPEDYVGTHSDGSS